MSAITEKQLQDVLDAFFNKESFLTFSPDLGVFYDNRAIGTWEPHGETSRKVALFHKGDNDPEYYQVKKDSAMNTNNKESKDMSKCKGVTFGRVLKSAKAKYEGTIISENELSNLFRRCGNNASVTVERDGQEFEVCKTHAKDNSCLIDTNKQSGATSIDQLIPAFDQGAVNNPESTKKGVAQMREALTNSKEKVMNNVTVKEASQVSENVDIDKVQQFANELYGTSYKMGQTYIQVSANSGQALDNSKPGYIFCGSEYVGKVVKIEGEFHIAFDYGDSNECINISKFNKEDSKVETKDQETLTADVFYCNVWSKGGRTIYYFNQEWKNVNRTRDDFVARAEQALGNKRDKAIVLKMGDKWAVITKVVVDGELVTKSVMADTMDLRKNMKR